MGNKHDIQPITARLYFLPVETRVPLKFGAETLTSVTCARVELRVRGREGREAHGWGETPLSVQWAWPSTQSYEARHTAMKDFCAYLAEHWAGFDSWGHAFEVGHDFIHGELPRLLKSFNHARGGEMMPWLAALVCCSAFDIALHDAYGKLHEKFIYDTYAPPFLSRDLSFYLEPARGADVKFGTKYPSDFLVQHTPRTLRAWHLVGGKDWIEPDEDDGSGPNDGYPVLLRDWVRLDGLKCLKVKLRGNDAAWDYARLVRVGEIAIEENVEWLTADFNGTVDSPAYVNEMLDRLVLEHPRIYGMILYTEQPFPYELEDYPIDAHSISARKPLFLDESAHDWRMVRRGRELGWTGVALKTCKTQTGALLSLCWAKAHGMTLMVQDLTNPMLAQIPHVLLAAHAGTIMGVETNAMQFYPDASIPEAQVHPGLYRRQNGNVDWISVRGPGFGYRLEQITRELPPPVIEIG